MLFWGVNFDDFSRRHFCYLLLRLGRKWSQKASQMETQMEPRGDLRQKWKNLVLACIYSISQGLAIPKSRYLWIDFRFISEGVQRNLLGDTFWRFVWFWCVLWAPVGFHLAHWRGVENLWIFDGFPGGTQDPSNPDKWWSKPGSGPPKQLEHISQKLTRDL